MINYWRKWKVFATSFLNGLEMKFLKGSKENDLIKLSDKSKTLLEECEDQLIENMTCNTEIINNLAFINGISTRQTLNEIISDLISLKQYELAKEDLLVNIKFIVN